jgi:hypothetical protein
MVNYTKGSDDTPPLFFRDNGPWFMPDICIPGHDDKEFVPEFA